MEQSMTDDMLEEIAWYAARASQSPVAVIQLPPERDPVEWIQDCLAKSIGQTVYGVALGSPEEAMEEAVVTAITGNGVASLANANFYMMCHTVVPLLIEEIRRLRKSLST